MGINTSDPPDLARAFAKKKGLSYPILIDEAGKASQLYGVDKLPCLVVIDRQGQVMAYLTGVIDEGSLDEIIAAAL